MCRVVGLSFLGGTVQKVLCKLKDQGELVGVGGVSVNRSSLVFRVDPNLYISLSG